MSPDEITRVIAVAALVIAVGDLALTWWLWTRSGPRLRVGLRRVDHPSDRLKDKLLVQVGNAGRMPVLIKEVGLEDRVSGSQGSSPTSYLSLSLTPTDGTALPRVLTPTDLPILAEATALIIMDRWAPGRKLTLVAWAKDGNDRKKTSRQVTFTTPRWPV